MSPEEIRNQCEDDADRAPSDLTVWRDRGAIIAALTARIAELEAQVRTSGSEALRAAADATNEDGFDVEVALLGVDFVRTWLRVQADLMERAL